MYAKHLNNYIISEKEDIYKAHWKLHKNGDILLVVNETQTFVGVITFSDIKKTYNNPQLLISDICNKKCHFIINGNNNYSDARNIYADFPHINHIPIIDNNKNIIDIMSRDRAFWKERYKEAKLPRMHYAYCIYLAALEAKALGYSSVSVIEFGVAGGNGLVNCEFHAKEISRILGIEIEVYGFDSAEGLPHKNLGYKDLINVFPGGSYYMNQDLLNERLQFSKLILGNIEETIRHFITSYTPAPIGCILIDVDYYSSTIPILKFLENDNEYFLPRVQMYFDDILPEYEFQGETLAIKEFNEQNKDIKISPEKAHYYLDYRAKTKICHRFLHEKYNIHTDVFFDTKMELELPLFDFL